MGDSIYKIFFFFLSYTDSYKKPSPCLTWLLALGERFYFLIVFFLILCVQKLVDTKGICLGCTNHFRKTMDFSVMLQTYKLLYEKLIILC